MYAHAQTHTRYYINMHIHAYLCSSTNNYIHVHSCSCTPHTKRNSPYPTFPSACTLSP